ncbi:MAG: hypothetical protein RMZ69_32455 [Nostoc sp. ChiQUE01a]|nr:hypothetical protein [Nostoc sp. ChiQUE01a]
MPAADITMLSNRVGKNFINVLTLLLRINIQLSPKVKGIGDWVISANKMATIDIQKAIA